MIYVTKGWLLIMYLKNKSAFNTFLKMNLSYVTFFKINLATKENSVSPQENGSIFIFLTSLSSHICSN